MLQALPLIQLNIPRVQLMIDRLKIAQGGARTLDLLVFIYFISLSLSLYISAFDHLSTAAPLNERMLCAITHSTGLLGTNSKNIQLDG